MNVLFALLAPSSLKTDLDELLANYEPNTPGAETTKCAVADMNRNAATPQATLTVKSSVNAGTVPGGRETEKKWAGKARSVSQARRRRRSIRSARNPPARSVRVVSLPATTSWTKRPAKRECHHVVSVLESRLFESTG